MFTQDVNRAFRAMRDLNTGITYVNAGTTGAEVHLPFGGTKDTGNGHREAGQAALDVFTEWKSIYVDYSGKLYRALIAGLEKALELGLDEVGVVSDSELLVKQMTGEYRVKNEALRKLQGEASRVARRIGDVSYTAVRREHNELADRLVNEALDTPE